MNLFIIGVFDFDIAIYNPHIDIFSNGYIGGNIYYNEKNEKIIRFPLLEELYLNNIEWTNLPELRVDILENQLSLINIINNSGSERYSNRLNTCKDTLSKASDYLSKMYIDIDKLKLESLYTIKSNGKSYTRVLNEFKSWFAKKYNDMNIVKLMVNSNELQDDKFRSKIMMKELNSFIIEKYIE